MKKKFTAGITLLMLMFSANLSVTAENLSTPEMMKTSEAKIEESQNKVIGGEEVIELDENLYIVKYDYETENYGGETFDETVEIDGVLYRISDTTTTLVDTIKDVEKITKTMEVTTSELPTQHYDFDEERVAVYNGEEYPAKFVSSYFTPVSTEAGTTSIVVHATGTFQFTKQISQPIFPTEKSFSVENAITGEQEQKTLYLEKIEQTSKEWGEEETLPFTFVTYSADTYDIDGYIFEHDDENCPLNANIDALYDIYDFDKENYKIIKAEWDGKVNKDDERKALVYYQRRTATYTGYYGADVIFLGNEEYPTTYIGHGLYEYQIENTNKIIYHYQSIVTYNAEVNDSSSLIETESSTDSIVSAVTELSSSQIDSISEPVKSTKIKITRTAVVGGSTATIAVSVAGLFFFMSNYVTLYDAERKRLCNCKIGIKGKIDIVKAVLLTGDNILYLKVNSKTAKRKIEKYGGLQVYISREKVECESTEGNTYIVYIKKREKPDSNTETID